jgi:hypothetical protein
MQLYRFKRICKGGNPLAFLYKLIFFLRRQALPDRLQWGAQTKQARYLRTSIYKQTINKTVHQIVPKAKTCCLKDSTRSDDHFGI